MPIHQVVAIGIRDILFRIKVEAVEKGLVRHHDRDQQAVTYSLGNRIIIIGRALDAKVAARAAGSHEGAVPIEVKLGNRGVHRGERNIVGKKAMRIGDIVGPDTGGTARIDSGLGKSTGSC